MTVSQQLPSVDCVDPFSYVKYSPLTNRDGTKLICDVHVPVNMKSPFNYNKFLVSSAVL
jgi:hypothetical protein